MKKGKPTTRRYSAEETAQAVRLVRQLRKELGTEHGTVARVAEQLIQSMGATGVCWDCAAAESFFGALEREFAHRRTWATRADARRDLIRWIEGWSNPRQLHSTQAAPAPPSRPRPTGTATKPTPTPEPPNQPVPRTRSTFSPGMEFGVDTVAMDPDVSCGYHSNHREGLGRSRATPRRRMTRGRERAETQSASR